MREHNATVQSEFSRQGSSFLSSEALNAEEVTNALASVVGSDLRRALDIACGPGILLPILSETARHTVGIDLTDANLRLARLQEGEKPIHLVRGVGETLPFGDGTDA